MYLFGRAVSPPTPLYLRYLHFFMRKQAIYPAAQFVLRLPTGQTYTIYIPPATRRETHNLLQLAKFSISADSKTKTLKASQLEPRYHPILRQWFADVHNHARKLYPQAKLAPEGPIFSTVARSIETAQKPKRQRTKPAIPTLPAKSRDTDIQPA